MVMHRRLFDVASVGTGRQGEVRPFLTQKGLLLFVARGGGSSIVRRYSTTLTGGVTATRLGRPGARTCSRK